MSAEKGSQAAGSSDGFTVERQRNARVDGGDYAHQVKKSKRWGKAGKK